MKEFWDDPLVALFVRAALESEKRKGSKRVATRRQAARPKGQEPGPKDAPDPDDNTDTPETLV